jgi:hypothetical protein
MKLTDQFKTVPPRKTASNYTATKTYSRDMAMFFAELQRTLSKMETSTRRWSDNLKDKDFSE